MTDKQREKEIIKDNITSANNTLVRTVALSMGSWAHDITSIRSKLKYCLKRTYDIKTTEDERFKKIWQYRQLLESLYFRVHFLEKEKG